MLYASSGREEAEQVPDPREVTVAVGRNVRAEGLGKLMAGVGTRHQVELWDVRIVAGDAMVSEAHPAGTRELLLVVEGELTLELDGVPHRVGPGDAIAFVADRPHTYRNAGQPELRFAMAVVVQQEPNGDRPGERHHHGTGERA